MVDHPVDMLVGVDRVDQPFAVGVSGCPGSPRTTETVIGDGLVPRCGPLTGQSRGPEAAIT
ncbi:hypothetical protein DSY14_21420 [Nocardiopsis sp. MG754419]|nr:hypothetical protein [Nocardiopsis sp. MG754419]